MTAGSCSQGTSEPARRRGARWAGCQPRGRDGIPLARPASPPAPRCLGTQGHVPACPQGGRAAGHSTRWQLSPFGCLALWGVPGAGDRQGQQQKAWEGCRLEVCFSTFPLPHFPLQQKASRAGAPGPPDPPAPAPCLRVLSAPPAPFSVDPEDKMGRKSEATEMRRAHRACQTATQPRAELGTELGTR